MHLIELSESVNEELKFINIHVVLVDGVLKFPEHVMGLAREPHGGVVVFEEAEVS